MNVNDNLTSDPQQQQEQQQEQQQSLPPEQVVETPSAPEQSPSRRKRKSTRKVLISSFSPPRQCKQVIYFPFREIVNQRTRTSPSAPAAATLGSLQWRVAKQTNSVQHRTTHAVLPGTAAPTAAAKSVATLLTARFRHVLPGSVFRLWIM